jgi:hypothetical protein
VMIEVLGAVVVDIEDAHCVVKVGVPRGWKVHGQREAVVGFSSKLALECMDNPVP